MSITLESRPCPVCGQENSVHINNCHQCGAVLPWAGEESTKVLTEPPKTTEPRQISPSQRKRLIAMYMVGGVIFIFGALLWIGNVSGLFPTFTGAGYITMGVAGALWRFGDRLLLGSE
jgi:hypothetical protein